MNISTRLVRTMLAMMFMLVGTFSAMFAAQCGFVPHTDAICNYGGCDLKINTCQGSDKATCEASWVSFNVKGAYACIFTGSKTDACVPAVTGGNPQYSICMDYEECSWQIMNSTCLPAGTWYDPCWAPYHMKTTC